MNRRLVIGSLGVWLVGCWLAVGAWAQESPAFYDYTRPGLAWYTLETEHFLIHFHQDEEGQGSSRTAQVVAAIAEDIYAPITELYAYTLDTKVSIILKDYEDYSNGAAYFFDNMIEIWAPALDTPLRGDHNWLRNVITHEFTHLVQVQKTMKASRRLPFLYFQLLDYEEVRRPDVLYGYPNVIVTYPIPILNNPAWLAEGTAQYQRAGLDYDQWDSHRDMLLRTRVLAGKELSLKEMGGFYSHTSLLRETVYNQGYAFTHYLANTYGEEVLRDISAALGQWTNWNFEQAAKDAVGIGGGDLYTDWIGALRTAYEAQSADVRAAIVAGEVLEKEGFSNFYPRFSPDGQQVAYLSNRGEDFNRMALYVQDLATGEMAVHYREGLKAAGTGHAFTCAFGHEHKLTAGTAGAFAWRPDGEALIVARIKDTPTGNLYSDLYELNLATKKETRLTEDARAAAPTYSPDAQQVAFVQQRDGSTNLMRLDLETKAITPLTAFDDGRQVTEPVWHPGGEWIYFGLMQARGRDLYRIRPDGTDLEAVRATDADERSPSFDPSGAWLYFSADDNGIFNLFRQPVDGGRTPERLTNVLGGAFQPNVAADGRMVFSQYQWDGYKIAVLEAATPLPQAAARATYAAPELLQKPGAAPLARPDGSLLATYADADIRPYGASLRTTVRRRGIGSLPGEAGDADATGDEPGVSRYANAFTSFSVFPVVRLDQYVSRQRSRAEVRLKDRTRGETLLRNTKVGFYAASREVMNGISFLGGLLVGPSSREAGGESLGEYLAPNNLLKLERDLFVQLNYSKGFGLLPRRWSPQLTVELFNIRRNVNRGLTIEEFPCTACLPDTTLADVAYNLWELNISMKSKVSRTLLLEAGYRYSPYRVTTERFFSKEFDAFIPESSSRYFIGTALRLKAYYEAFHPYTDANVVPRGLRVEAEYEYEPGRLLDRFNIEDGLLVPEYETFKNHRLTVEARYGWRLFEDRRGGTHGVGVRVRGSTLLGKPVDDFFNDYVGGLIGARGYPFYALGGNETLWGQLSYTVPLLPRINKQLGFLYADKLYARLYADAAMAWSGAWPGFGNARKDIGAELRLGLGSFYLLPTAVFVSATYGLDTFDFQLDGDFVTPDGSDAVRYGGEWLWHFGVLFGFDL